MHKYMPQTLGGPEYYQWHPEVKHMRPCHCCLYGMVSNQLVFMTIPRNDPGLVLSEAQRCSMSVESYVSWSHAAEREIKELKKRVHCKLLQ